MVKESNGTIFNYLFIDLDLHQVKVILILDFSVILGQRRLCSYNISIISHVLFNVSTAFLAFIVSSIHHDILNTPLSKSLVTLGGLVLKLLLLAKDSA